MKQPAGPSDKAASTAPLAVASNGGGTRSSGVSSNSSSGQKQKRRLPTPQDLIAHYESQGMETKEAAIKVIDDLQRALFRTVTSTRGRKDRFMAETSKKLDNVSARLAIVEMKLDSKPGYPESLAVGVLSAASFRGIAAAWPHAAGAVAHIWNSVRGFTGRNQ